MKNPRNTPDAEIIGKIQDRLYESPIKEDLGDHREDCAFAEDANEECTCEELNEADKETYYEDQAMERYYAEKYGE